jgi:hypothetical protein
METSVNKLTPEWILSAEEIEEIKAVDQEEMYGNAYEVRARELAYESGQEFQTPTQNKLFKMRIQQVQILEIEVEGVNANEAQDRALRIIENAPEMSEVIRTDLSHSTIEEI